MLVSINNLTFGYDDKPVLEDITVNLDPGARVGLVGANGAGKSTLLQLLLGKLKADEGTISQKSGLKTGYLSQGSGLSSSRTAEEEMRSALSDIWECEAQLRQVERQMSSAVEGSAEFAGLARKHRALENYMAANDGYSAEVRIRSVLSGMGFSGAENKITSHMSGGEKTRLALARLLLEPLDLLVLDEPTNHLDFATLGWLENFLASYRGALLIVSHDRYFLDKTVTSIWELERKRLSAYPGNYTKYRRLKKERNERALSQHIRQQEEIARKLDYVQRNIARASTSKSAKSRLKQIEHMEIIEKPPQEFEPAFHFEQGSPSSQEVLGVSGIDVSADGVTTLISGAEIAVRRGARAAFVGANGTGKSTLFKLLESSIKRPMPGIRWGKNVNAGYYDQENRNLNPNNTVLEELWYRFPGMPQHKARAMLARLNLGAEDMEKQVSVLSGGERVKLGLSVLSAGQANTLLLDEPTNHLDLSSREALEDALSEYEGTLLFVSHDRYLVRALATEIYEIEDNRLVRYQCGFEEYSEQKRKARTEAEGQRAQADSMQKPAPAKQGTYRSAAQRAEEAKQRQALSRTEKRITELEDELSDVEAEISGPRAAADYKYLMEVCARQEELAAQLERLYAEWEGLVSGTQKS